ncbi:MAG: choice-of-anchor D domain-containing protein [Spirochaetales bacterium]|nr:choice-of-anchor D domain-containing protein [Spirochaetales bacterium]
MKKILILLSAVILIYLWGCDDPTSMDAETYTETSILSFSIDSSIENGGSYTFTDSKIFTTEEVTATIKNEGDSELTITNVALSGDDSDNFNLISEPDSSIAAGASSSFKIAFDGLSTGEKNATLTISNNDSDNSTFTVTLNGTGTSRAWTEVTSSLDWTLSTDSDTVVFNNELCSVSDSGVYSSSDGKTWESKTTSNTYEYGSRNIVFNEKLWNMGGYLLLGNDKSYTNYDTIYSSSDGANWAQVETSGDIWDGRSNMGLLVYKDKMWILGGRYFSAYQVSDYYSDVWSSSDGKTWTQVTDSASWGKIICQGVVVFDDKMWVLGGYDGSSSSYLNDIWYSSNGEDWTEVTSSPGWSARSSFGVVVYDDKMWILGGYTENESYANDIWYSSDGENWTEFSSSNDWAARSLMGTVVYNDKIWLVGGYYYDGSTYTGTDYDDIWSW